MEELLTLKQEYLNREGMWLTSIFEQHHVERETKENSMRKKKRLRTFLINHKSCYLHPNYQFRKEIQTSTEIAPKVTKERGPRGTMHSQYLMPNYFQYWSKNTRFPLFIPAKPRKPPYPEWYDFSARCEYHGGVEGHSIESCTSFKVKVQALIDADLAKFQELFRGLQG